MSEFSYINILLIGIILVGWGDFRVKFRFIWYRFYIFIDYCFGSLLGNLLVLLILLVLDMFDCFRALFRWNILFLLFDKEFWGLISKVLLIFDIFEFLWMSYLLKFDGRYDIFLLLILTLLNLLFCLLKLYFLCLEWLEFIFRIFRLDFFGYE